MPVNESVVENLTTLAKAHDDMAKRKGYRADRETDEAMAKYRGARERASGEDIAEFERRYMR